MKRFGPGAQVMTGLLVAAAMLGAGTAMADASRLEGDLGFKRANASLPPINIALNEHP